MVLKQIYDRGRMPVKRWLASLLLLFFIITIPWNYFNKADDYLVIRKVKTNDLILLEKMPSSMDFILHYIHSVDRQPVIEKYEVLSNREIVLRENKFKMFGAGMGHFSGEGTLVSEDGWTVIRGLERKVDPIYLRIGYTSDLTLMVGGTEILLSIPQHYGELVIVRIEELTKLEVLLKGVKNIWANQL